MWNWWFGYINLCSQPWGCILVKKAGPVSISLSWPGCLTRRSSNNHRHCTALDCALSEIKDPSEKPLITPRTVLQTTSKKTNEGMQNRVAMREQWKVATHKLKSLCRHYRGLACLTSTMVYYWLHDMALTVYKMNLSSWPTDSSRSSMSLFSPTAVQSKVRKKPYSRMLLILPTTMSPLSKSLYSIALLSS